MRSPTRSLLVCFAASVALAVLGGCGARTGTGASPITAEATAATAATPAEPSAEERILWYRARIAEKPRLYPMHTQLGLALFDRARETHDPSLLAEARSAELRSLAIQASFEAMVAMARIQSWSHRFEEAISWAQRAGTASVAGTATSDPELAAILVEAWLGLGRIDEARRLVPRSAEEAASFHAAASLARVLEAENRLDEAALAHGRAAALATDAGAAELAAWAETALAGNCIDRGRLAEAEEHLRRAAHLAPPTSFLRLHRAELAAARGERQEALSILEEALGDDPDPELHAEAWRAAKAAGSEKSAARHYAEAEAGFRRAIDAGEVHTLGALARLWTQAGLHRAEALSLAKENLRFKRDRDALQTRALAGNSDGRARAGLRDDRSPRDR